jgi:uncharacterized phiE125 gp8 family phage protein
VINAYEALANARVVTVTAPAEEPISLDEAKAQLRRDADFVADDVMIAALVQAAREQVESFTGRALITQTLDLTFDEPPCDRFVLLPRPQLQSVTSVTTYDQDNVGTVVSSSDYFVDTASAPGRIALGTNDNWYTNVTLRETNGFVVRAVCGYGNRTAVPEAIKRAMLLICSTLYEHREQVVISQFAGQFIDLPYGIRHLLEPYKLWVC